MNFAYALYNPDSNDPKIGVGSLVLSIAEKTIKVTFTPSKPFINEYSSHHQGTVTITLPINTTVSSTSFSKSINICRVNVTDSSIIDEMSFVTDVIAGGSAEGRDGDPFTVLNGCLSINDSKGAHYQGSIVGTSL